MNANKFIKLLLTFFLFLSPLFKLHGYSLIPTSPLNYVYDIAQILTKEGEIKIDSIASELEEKNSSQVIVVTLPSIDNSTLEDVAIDIFAQLQPGTKHQDNGVLLLISYQDRMARIETGYGTEAVLPDLICSRILQNELFPFFKEGRYDEGVITSVKKISDFLLELESVEDYKKNTSSSPLPFFIGIIILFILFVVISKLGKGNHYSGGSNSSRGGGGFFPFTGGSSRSSFGGFSGGGFRGGGGSSGGGGASGRW